MNKPASMLFKKHQHLILTEVPLFCVCAHAFLAVASYIYFFFFWWWFLLVEWKAIDFGEPIKQQT